MGLAFTTGYWHLGHLEMRPKAIARRYLRTWFVPDAVVVFSDWLSFASTYAGQEDSAVAVKLLRLFKIGRLVRLLRVLRMAKLSEIMARISEKTLTTPLRHLVETSGSFSLGVRGQLSVRKELECFLMSMLHFCLGKELLLVSVASISLMCKDV